MTKILEQVGTGKFQICRFGHIQMKKLKLNGDHILLTLIFALTLISIVFISQIIAKELQEQRDLDSYKTRTNAILECQRLSVDAQWKKLDKWKYIDCIKEIKIILPTNLGVI